ncbi:MAG: biotin/lipoyl-binding protein [Thermodesulfobacteriota bacterium]
MAESVIDTKRLKTKAFGVLLAGLVAIASLILVTVTHGPKKAVSSPSVARAAIMPEIQDSKSEAEILFRGKSFALIKRNVMSQLGGIIDKIDVREGQFVKAGQVLGSYTLDRESLNRVQQSMYPASVLSLKNSMSARSNTIEKIRESGLPVKKLQLERAENELKVMRELTAKGMGNANAVREREREVEAVKKQIWELKVNMEDAETDLKKTKHDLEEAERKHKADMGILEWQAERKFPEASVPLSKGFFKAPISGRIVWMSPLAREDHEFKAGFVFMMVAPMDSVVVRCKVHELDLVKLKPNDRGTVSFDAIPKTEFRCTVLRIPWTPQNPSLEVPADYDIECLIEDAEGRIKEGLTCNVKVSVSLAQ